MSKLLSLRFHLSLTGVIFVIPLYLRGRPPPQSKDPQSICPSSDNTRTPEPIYKYRLSKSEACVLPFRFPSQNVISISSRPHFPSISPLNLKNEKRKKKPSFVFLILLRALVQMFFS